MKKCYWCNWHTDKCKNKNSKNYDCDADYIESCKPMLIDKSKAGEIRFKKPADDSV